MYFLLLKCYVWAGLSPILEQSEVREDPWPETPLLSPDSSVARGNPHSRLQILLAQLPFGLLLAPGGKSTHDMTSPQENRWGKGLCRLRQLGREFQGPPILVSLGTLSKGVGVGSG